MICNNGRVTFTKPSPFVCFADISPTLWGNLPFSTTAQSWVDNDFLQRVVDIGNDPYGLERYKTKTGDHTGSPLRLTDRLMWG